jgi:hypothetical protein
MTRGHKAKKQLTGLQAKERASEKGGKCPRTGQAREDQ